ncbi:unnamed protein product [Cochlearia groenlandica]
MATQNNLELYLCGFVKIFNEQWQADVRLKAGDSAESEAIPAHKLVLAARSEVFKKILESDNLKANDVEIETVTMSDMKQEELEAFVEFIYNNRSSLSVKEKKHARSLFVAADKYEIPHLKELCRQELISSLKISNVVDLLQLSLNLLDQSLTDSAAIFVSRNLVAMCDTVEFKLFVGVNPDFTIQIMKASQSRRCNGNYF